MDTFPKLFFNGVTIFIEDLILDNRSKVGRQILSLQRDVNLC